MTIFAHRVAEGERIRHEAGPTTLNEFDRLIATLTSILNKFDVDPRDPNTGEVLYGQVAFKAALQVQNTLSFPTLATELGSDTNSFDPQDRVLLQLRPDGANRTIHGFKAPAGPDQTPLLIVLNDDENFDLVLVHNSSTANVPRDQMVLAGGVNITLRAGDAKSIWLTYSHLLNRWVQVSSSDAGVNVVAAVGAAADDQLAVWTGTKGIEGDSNLTWDESRLTVLGSLVLGTINPSLAGGTFDDFNPTGLAQATVINITRTGNVILTGMAGGVNGRIIILVIEKSSNFGFSINNDDAGSTAANRFFCPNATTFALTQPTELGRAIPLIYNGTESRWFFAGYGTI